MADLETVISGLRDIGGFIAGRIGFGQARNFLRTIDNAIALLKEQKALLNKAYELLADMGLDFFCEDLICNDGWCDDHCTTNGTTPECIERWLRKQIEEG